MPPPNLLPCYWLSASALLSISLARETFGWVVRPVCCATQRGTPSTCGRITHVQSGRRHVMLQRTLTALGPRSWELMRHAALNAHANEDRGAEVVDDEASGTAEQGANDGAAAAPPDRQPQGMQVAADEDSDVPILYIKGLKKSRAVAAAGSGGKNSKSGNEDDVGVGLSRVMGGGNTAMMARALRDAEREIEGGGNYEEGVVEAREEDGDELADPRPVWRKVEAALGLGVWSYVGLGLAVFIIALNNILGVGWAAKILNPDYDPDTVLTTEQQGRQIQYMPLDDESNLLSE